MSLFLYPAHAPHFAASRSRGHVYDDRHALYHQPVQQLSGRCGSVHHHGLASMVGGRHPFYTEDASYDDDGMDIDILDLSAVIQHKHEQQRRAAHERAIAARRRQQQQLEAQRRHREEQQRQAYLALAAAASAWKQQQQQQAEAERQRIEFARRLAYAHHVQEQQQQQRRREQQALLRRQAEQEAERERKAALYRQQQVLQVQQERRRQTRAWEREMQAAAAQGISTFFDLAQHFLGGLDETNEQEHRDVKPQETQVQPQGGESSTRQVPIAVSTSSEGQATAEHIDDDPEEVLPTPPSSENVSTQPVETAPVLSAPETQAREKMTVFTYALPSDASRRAAVKASDIDVSYDGASHSLKIAGLWSNDGPLPRRTSTSSDDGSDSSRGRKRTRSPKRPHVSDVDEMTGEEIEQPEKSLDDDEDYVEVESTISKSSIPGATTAPVSVALPSGADISRLQVDLTDDGLQVSI